MSTPRDALRALIRRLYGRAQSVKAGPSGRLASSRSKTGDPKCSAAASKLALRQATSDDQVQLARCRAMSKGQRAATLQRAAGHEAKARHLEHRVAGGVRGGAVTGPERKARAVERLAERVKRNEGRGAKAAPKAPIRPSHPSLLERIDRIVARRPSLPVPELHRLARGEKVPVPPKTLERVRQSGGSAEEEEPLFTTGRELNAFHRRVLSVGTNDQQISEGDAVKALKRFRDRYREARAAASAVSAVSAPAAPPPSGSPPTPTPTITPRPPRPTIAQRLVRRAERGQQIVVDRLGTVVVPPKTYERVKEGGPAIDAASEKQEKYARDVRSRRAQDILHRTGQNIIEAARKIKRSGDQVEQPTKETAKLTLQKLRDKYREARAVNRMTSARDILDQKPPLDPVEAARKAIAERVKQRAPAAPAPAAPAPAAPAPAAPAPAAPAPVTQGEKASPSPVAAPSLREQAAMHREAKGKRSQRLEALAERAKQTVRKNEVTHRDLAIPVDKEIQDLRDKAKRARKPENREKLEAEAKAIYDRVLPRVKSLSDRIFKDVEIAKRAREEIPFARGGERGFDREETAKRRTMAWSLRQLRNWNSRVSPQIAITNPELADRVRSHQVKLRQRIAAKQAAKQAEAQASEKRQRTQGYRDQAREDLQATLAERLQERTEKREAKGFTAEGKREAPLTFEHKAAIRSLIGRAQARQQHAMARTINQENKEDDRANQERYGHVKVPTRETHFSNAAEVRKIRAKFHALPETQAKIAEQSARAEVKHRKRFPLFGGQTPDERPLGMRAQYSRPLIHLTRTSTGLIRLQYARTSGNAAPLQVSPEACSKAASEWRRKQANTDTHRQLAACRAAKRGAGQAKAQRNAGQEGRARHIEHRHASGQLVTATARKAEAKRIKRLSPEERRAEREKAAGGKDRPEREKARAAKGANQGATTPLPSGSPEPEVKPAAKPVESPEKVAQKEEGAANAAGAVKPLVDVAEPTPSTSTAPTPRIIKLRREPATLEGVAAKTAIHDAMAAREHMNWAHREYGFGSDELHAAERNFVAKRKLAGKAMKAAGIPMQGKANRPSFVGSGFPETGAGLRGDAAPAVAKEPAKAKPKVAQKGQGAAPAPAPTPKPAEPTGFDPSKSYAVNGKEPWEMTGQEWRQEFDRHAPATLGGVGRESTQKRGGGDTMRRIEHESRMKMDLPDVQDPDGILSPFGARHREVVEAAVKAGKPVPAHIMAEYPKLAPAPTKLPPVSPAMSEPSGAAAQPRPSRPPGSDAHGTTDEQVAHAIAIKHKVKAELALKATHAVLGADHPATVAARSKLQEARARVRETERDDFRVSPPGGSGMAAPGEPGPKQSTPAAKPSLSGSPSTAPAVPTTSTPQSHESHESHDKAIRSAYPQIFRGQEPDDRGLLLGQIAKHSGLSEEQTRDALVRHKKSGAVEFDYLSEQDKAMFGPKDLGRYQVDPENGKHIGAVRFFKPHLIGK